MSNGPMSGADLREAISGMVAIPLDGVTAALSAAGSSWQRVAETAHAIASRYDDAAHPYAYAGAVAGYIEAAVHAMPPRDGDEDGR